MKRNGFSVFFVTLFLTFISLFLGTLVIFIFGGVLLSTSTVGSLSGKALVIILTLVIIWWQGKPIWSEIREMDTRPTAIFRILAIVIALFVWYFSCGQILLNGYIG